jgi:hypothetical protein
VGTAIVVGVKDREPNKISTAVVDTTPVAQCVERDATINTDELGSYRGLPTTNP